MLNPAMPESLLLLSLIMALCFVVCDVDMVTLLHNTDRLHNNVSAKMFNQRRKTTYTEDHFL